MELARRYTTITLVALAALVGLFIMPADAYKDVTQELIALFGLMMAGVLPTMILTASALRSGNLSVRRLKSYRDALLTQLHVWIGLFLISFACGLLVLVGKMVSWSIPMSIPVASPIQLDLARVLCAALTAGLALVTLRVFAIGRGIISLLLLSSELAFAEADARDRERFAKAERAIAKSVDDPNHGRFVELPH